MGITITSPAIPWLKPEGLGSVVADGSEQLLLEVTVKRISGFVDLTPLQGGDTVVVRSYVDSDMGGGYKKYAEEPYVGPSNVLYITPRESPGKLKFTLQQTAGVMRTFPYKFMWG